MNPHRHVRLIKALSRLGLDAERQGPVWSLRVGAARAEVLLPDSLPVEGAALRQLADLAGVRDPAGRAPCRVCATPDFHPGDSGVAIGSVVETDGMVIPAAVGSDINCGMRLHVADVDLDRFEAVRERFVEALKGDLFLGTRDVSLRASGMVDLFEGGLSGWILAQRVQAEGLGRRSDLAQLEAELGRVALGGSLRGRRRWAPPDLVPDAGVVRDGGLATVGGGNHFVEIQVVEEVLDRGRAFAWGVRAGQLAFMIHSGSRNVGKHVGHHWKHRAREAWPSGLKHPPSGIFPVSDPEELSLYLEAEATAANYGFVNRMLLAELVRQRLRELLGAVEAPLVADLPHNITLEEEGRLVARKGACPAPEGAPVVIPGSMGASSFLLVGRGQERWLRSASHGAGRARSRFEMGRMPAGELGLEGVRCVTLKEERRIEEAPAAYKPIGEVIGAQVEAGMVGVVARLRPLLTFKA